MSEFAAALHDAGLKGEAMQEPCERRARPRTSEPYARISKSGLTALVQAMPDTQSAVLACLAWQAAMQERLVRGPLAGQRLARVSASTLASDTGRPLRTVRWALSELKRKGRIETVGNEAGKTAIYRVTVAVSGEEDEK